MSKRCTCSTLFILKHYVVLKLVNHGIMIKQRIRFINQYFM